ncbi:hypothetical protein LCGC14_0577900 [marine sediment metagenome]|uniref:Major tropism determinant N-terminal domain-containing protein n=1 Tax=marine sediment metagenome TaxID=412755 RepID=A0A0F9RME1_9ZZZZ
MSSNKTLQVPKVIPNDWVRLRIIIDKLKHLRLGGGSTPEFAGIKLTGLTDDSLIYPSGGGTLTSLGVAANGQLPIGSTGATPVLATITGTTDHISVTNGAGSIALDLDTNTQTLLGSFNGMMLEKLDFTISEAGGTVTGSLEQDSGGDLTQRFSDGYTTLDCTPALTIDLTAYVGTNAVPKVVYVYILQSAKTVMAASNSDWPATEHIRIANLLLKSAATTGTDGGALVNRNWNDFAFDGVSQGHITHIENRIRQEPTQWDSGVALTLKNSAGAALNTGNSSTAVEIVTTAGTAYQLHKHTFPAFDMYTTATDDAHIVNQPTDEGGAYETTADLVTDVTHYVDGTAAGVAIGINKYFNLVIWGIQNRMGEASHVMINLPTGQYNTSADATSDIDGTSIYDIPALSKGVGFLIARLTFRLIAGSQWTYIAQEDLRGQVPPVSAGVGVTTTDHALLANLDFASAGHTGFQAQGDVLDDLNTLGQVGANSEFLVGTGAGTLAWESGTTARTSIGLGTGDSPQFAGLTILTTGEINFRDTDISIGSTLFDGILDISADIEVDFFYDNADVGDAVDGQSVYIYRRAAVGDDYIRLYVDSDRKGSINFNGVDLLQLSTTAVTVNGAIELGHASDTTLARATAGNVNIEGKLVYRADGTDVPIADGGSGQSTAQLAINALSAVSGATNEHVLTKDTGTGNAIFKAAAGGGSDVKVGVDVGATAGFLGAASGDGVLRTGSKLSYTDGGNFVTIDTVLGTRFSAYQVVADAQSITRITYTKILFPTEDWDIGGEFASSRFTPTVAGYYRASMGVTMLGMADGDYIEAGLYRNTIFADGIARNIVILGGSGAAAINAIRVFYLNGSTDYLECYVYHDSATSKSTQGHDTAYPTFFDAERVG